ncbi:MAG TPA: GYF domain-containing protein, partial [Candidatus Angelobacter sp.]|nr:GYF domain-containing protein [Candidatus Angelobacter sp.]
EYGPYTLADLQRYVAQGSILLTDLTRSEGMTEWTPVSQVLGNIPVQVPAATMQVSGSPTYGSASGGTGTVYSGTPSYAGQAGSATPGGPVPPDFHWALVLLVGFFCNLFQLIWLFVEAGFVKKIDRESKAVALLAASLVTVMVGFVIFFSSIDVNRDLHGPPAFLLPFFLIVIAGVVLHLMAVFQMRSSIENYYNTVEPINLRLSGVMTFFFAVYYFQHHFSRIANWKRTGYLQPQ